jgi:hypothetical protein
MSDDKRDYITIRVEVYQNVTLAPALLKTAKLRARDLTRKIGLTFQ